MRGGIATDFAPRALRRANALAGQTLDNPENRRPAKCQVVTVLDQDISYGRVRCTAGRPFSFGWRSASALPQRPALQAALAAGVTSSGAQP